MFKLDERLVYIRPDNVKYLLHAPPSRSVLQTEGFGNPPVEYVADRAPFQHGQSIRTFHLLPRSLQIVTMQNLCSRADYWAGRQELLDAIRVNRIQDFDVTGKLLYYLSGGGKRQIDVVPESGPGFVPEQDGWRSWSFTEALRFIASDPTWYDPALQSIAFTAAESSIDELEFPITFPIQFATFGGTTSITYAGTWLAYPTITMNGPIVGPVITNQTTGDEIGLDYSIASGETVTIVLRGLKSITNNSGTNLLNKLTSTSDLTTFAIYPEPQAADGINIISASGSGTNSNSTVTIRYYTRYIGI